MKSLLLGIILIIILGFGGLVYRNAVEHPNQPIACPMDAKLCPDGTAVGRTGSSCTFPECPPPNVSFGEANIAFAVPAGFSPAEATDVSTIAAYELAASSTASSTPSARIVIRRYLVDASSTPASVIRQTAIGTPSDLPLPVTAFSSAEYDYRSYTVAAIERFEGVIDTAYYLKRPDRGDVLRFDAIDTGVGNWTDTSLDRSTLPAHAALEKLLSALQVL